MLFFFLNFVMIKFNSTLTFSFIYSFIFRFLCVKDINCVILMDRGDVKNVRCSEGGEDFRGERFNAVFTIFTLIFARGHIMKES